MIDLKALTAPFAPERISWRVGSTTADKKRGLALAYIDARDVMERLDAACGPANWQCRYPHADGKTVCELGIRLGDEWIWKADGAGDTDFEADKGALSDAFKRAAVRWGIGRYLYELDAPWVDIEPAGRGARIAAHELPKLRALLGRKESAAAAKAGSPAARPAKPAPARGFPLRDPETDEVVWHERGGAFLEALEGAMKTGDAAAWWEANSAAAQAVAERFPHARRRVQDLAQLTLQAA